MATKNAKKRTAKNKRKAPDAGALVTTQRKKEVLGLILMVLAALLTLALVTYHPADNGLANNFSLAAALDPGDDMASNALGLVGAALSMVFVQAFLGYTTILFFGLLFAWGYAIFREGSKLRLYLPFMTSLTLIGAVVIACIFGWFGIVTEANLLLWSGTVGMGSAGWMVQLFGRIGSFVLLLALLAVTLLLTVDRDIQRTIDRFEEGLFDLREWFAERWIVFRTRTQERRAERATLLEARRAERAAARTERREADAARRAGKADAPAPAARRTEPRPAARPEAPIDRSDSRPVLRDRSPEPTFTPPPRRSEPPSPPAPRALPSAGDATPHTAPPRLQGPLGEPELKIRERVQEEKADDIEREAEVPDEDLELHYRFPTIDLLDEPDDNQTRIDYDELEENKRVLLDTLDTYKIEITEINAIVGPTVTLYELTPAPGIKISRITALEDDLAMAMAARGIRMIAPIPGKSAIGVEIPNRQRELVQIRDVLGTAKFRDAQMELPITIGKSIEGEVFMQDLTKMPHLLIAGATGSGKSVGLNTLIAGLLYACHPANLKFVMIDPKKIELQQYRMLTDHYLAIPEDGSDAIITDVAEALGVLKSCEREMERRYDLLAKASVRGIKDYNRKLQEGKLDANGGFRHLPYIVVIVDELADLMMTAGKEIEGPIARLAQMARAVGIHLVLATQRPSVDVITGLIKANFPARIAYQVASKIDSRTILDQNGAQGLVGNGDLLFMMGSHIVRLQGPYVSVEEIDHIMDFIENQPGRGPYLLPPGSEQAEIEDVVMGVEETDDLFEEAARIIVRSQQGSVSLLQRKLSVGYTRAARIVDQLEEAGIVGPFVGSKAREVMVETEVQLDNLLSADEEEPS